MRSIILTGQEPDARLRDLHKKMIRKYGKDAEIRICVKSRK